MSPLLFKTEAISNRPVFVAKLSHRSSAIGNRRLSVSSCLSFFFRGYRLWGKQRGSTLWEISDFPQGGSG